MILNPNCSEATMRIDLTDLTDEEIQKLVALLETFDSITNDEIKSKNYNINTKQLLIEEENEDKQVIPSFLNWIEIDDVKENWWETQWWEDSIFGRRIMTIKGETPFNAGEWLIRQIKRLRLGERIGYEIRWEFEDS